jgi:predicted nucleic acid-binding protein
MKIFCDTNVLIAAFLANHPQHNSARPVVTRVKAGQDEGFIAAHSLAEVYAVLTRLPGANQVPPLVAWKLISENLLQDFSIVNLTAKEYANALEDAADKGIEGGKTYDALLLAAAAKVTADRIYTVNVRHFQSLAEPALRSHIVAP